MQGPAKNKIHANGHCTVLKGDLACDNLIEGMREERYPAKSWYVCLANAVGDAPASR